MIVNVMVVVGVLLSSTIPNVCVSSIIVFSIVVVVVVVCAISLSLFLTRLLL